MATCTRHDGGADWSGFDPDVLIEILRIANAIGNAAAPQRAIAGSQAVTAVTLQRAIPAQAASAGEPAGVSTSGRWAYLDEHDTRAPPKGRLRAGLFWPGRVEQQRLSEGALCTLGRRLMRRLPYGRSFRTSE